MGKGFAPVKAKPWFYSVLEQVKLQDLWSGDRNFCTREFLFTIKQKKVFFVIRQHGDLGFKELLVLMFLLLVLPLWFNLIHIK